MRRFLLLFVMALIVVPVGAAQAETIDVTNTNDSGDGSLRAALLAANGHSGEDAVAIGVSGAIQLKTALPIVEGDLTITGPGPGSLAIEPAAATGFRILSFGDGIAAVVSGLTIRGGTSPQGGGIRSGDGSLVLTRVVVAENEARDESGTEVEAEGGGVFSDGELVLREATIRDNAAIATAGTTSSSTLGGGILAAGPITVERSTISGNDAEAHGEGGKHS